MKRNPVVVVGIIFLLFAAFGILVVGASMLSFFHENGGSGAGVVQPKKPNSLLSLEIRGVIFDSQKFLKKLKNYRDSKDIKGIILRIDSPGGSVGASEEIYNALRQLKEKFKKPIVVYSPNLNASGGYYVSLAADKIVVSRGTLIGSIGVIMEFANLEKLYDWAHVSRYSITSGKFKDSGAEYRAMRDDEKEYFQSLVNSAYHQFRGTVVENRKKVSPENIELYTDGRVFSGEQAVQLGFADQIGNFDDAVASLAELAGVGEDYEVFEPPKRKPGLLERLVTGPGEDEEEMGSLLPIGKFSGHDWMKKIETLLKVKLLGRPLYLMQGTWAEENE